MDTYERLRDKRQRGETESLGSLVRFKGKYDNYDKFCKDSKLHGKKVKILETHKRYGNTLEEGEEGIIGGHYVSSFAECDLKEEIPIFIPRLDKTIGIEYENLGLVE